MARITKTRKKKQVRVSVPKESKGRPRNPSHSEVEAYSFIRNHLKDLGWNVKNPSLGTGGQVWTQNQCLSDPDLKAAFGASRPENVVRLDEQRVWIIEAKASQGGLDSAVAEARDDYASAINTRCKNTSAVLASGVAGNDLTGYATATYFKTKAGWKRVTINDRDATGLLTPENVSSLLASGKADIRDYAPPQRIFLQAAERINAMLHNGGIIKSERAKVMAALLLAVVKDPPSVTSQLTVLINDINGRTKAILQENGKPDFAPFVHLLPPTNTTNHVKYKQALVDTIQELLKLNIRSAMDSSTDVLGQFYEVFLKYGNGAKEIGIVLTPRHITRFAVDAIGVSHKDVVLDLACGTGGFLVAAFDHVRRNSTPAQLEVFKQHNLFGIEEQSHIALLAIVNMIFRGDGKHNITEGNCFTTEIVKKTVKGHPSARFSKTAPPVGQEAITRVLMNPPFSLPTSPYKEHRFVSRALSLMDDNGILFSLLPMDSMFGAHEEREWREHELLANHTLLAVVSLPDELFYPAAMKQVVAIVVRKGVSHPKRQHVFWGKVTRDGQLKVKSKRLEASALLPPRVELNQLELILPDLQSFLARPEKSRVNKAKLCKTAPIDFTDPLLELLPEAYIDNEKPTKEAVEMALERMTREVAAFLIKSGTEDRH